MAYLGPELSDGFDAAPYFTPDTDVLLKVFTTRAGYEARIWLNGKMGNLCGYVVVPEGHPWHGKRIFDIHADVHMGVTFSGRDKRAKEDEEKRSAWLVGFDCGHFGDYIPALCMPDFGFRTSFVERQKSFHRWTVDEVSAECERLATQARTAAFPDTERSPEWVPDEQERIDVAKRLQAIAELEDIWTRERAAAEEWVWLSYADPEEGFLGAIVTRAQGFLTAALKVKELGIGPPSIAPKHVSVKRVPVKFDIDPPPSYVDRLLNQEETLALQAILQTRLPTKES
jgi:hypothetical protein